ncbi:MAG: hypothetical protein HXS47_00195 [Theionarchaea archaeon]|nr:hypothetical protein [Theionarchaea archaeon]
MFKDDPKQHKFLFSPIVFEKLIPEDHFYRKPIQSVVPSTVKIWGDRSQIIPGRCSKLTFSSSIMTGLIEKWRNRPPITLQ